MQKKKKVLLTGGSGLLALNWAVHIMHAFDVVLGMHQKNISIPGIATIPINMETTVAFSADLQKIQPDIVIHCAGLANVEACEADPEAAYHINVVLSVNVAKACREQNVSFIYIATDHLFSGEKSLLSEDETPSPVNEYGKTKLEAERRTLDICGDNLSIRTNFYGWGPSYRSSFSDMIIRNMRDHRCISLFDDFFYTPILIAALADTTMQLHEKKANGIYNVVGDQRISKYEFGIFVADHFHLDHSLIKAAKFAERKDLVKRPRDLSLSVEKTTAFLKKNIGSVHAGIEQLKWQEQQQPFTAIRNL